MISKWPREMLGSIMQRSVVLCVVVSAQRILPRIEDRERSDEALLEISTTRCGHMTITQLILSDLQAGDLLEIVVWHSPLVSETPARCLMSVVLEEVMLW